MTMDQATLIRRLAWLCAELRAGNNFSDETLMRLERQARRELALDEQAKRDSAMRAAAEAFTARHK